MFIDYYAILNISIEANQAAIKAAFKEQAIKWHPDKNPGIDTTQRMQLINEAYLMLKDLDARQRYDNEYRNYTKQQNQSHTSQEHKKRTQNKQTDQTEDKFDQSFEDNSYEIFDETLKRWMSNARTQASALAKQTIEDMKGMSKAGGQAIIEAALGGIVKYIVFSIIILIIFKACQN
jgi:curved DNA-binding protein CbpA